jgi:membrane protease YdiL (CAAX protease family)
VSSSEDVVDRKPFAPLPTLLFILGIVGIALPGLVIIALLYFLTKLYLRGPVVASIFFEHLRNHHVIPPAGLVTTSDALIIQILSDIMIAAFVYWRLPYIACASLHDLGIRKPKRHDIAMAFAGVGAAFVLTSLTGVVAQALTHRQIHQDTIKIFMNLPLSGQIIGAIAAIIVAPIAEELFFRGVIFNALSIYMPKIGAIIISGIIFGLAHGQMDVVPELAVTGMVLATVYDNTRCIWSNMLSHAMFNSISVVAIMVFHQSS